jgi:hypothetical protein
MNSPSKVKSINISNTNANSLQSSIIKNTLINNKTIKFINQSSPNFISNKNKNDISMSIISNNLKDINGKKSERYDFFGNLIKKRGKHKIIFADKITDKSLLDISFFDQDKLEKIEYDKTAIDKNNDIKVKYSTNGSVKSTVICKDDTTCACLIF